MTTLFYLFFMPFLLYEIAILIKPLSFIKLKDRIIASKGKDLSKEDNIKYTVLAAINILYLLWTFTGLMSSQWLVFACIIVLVPIDSVLNKMLKSYAPLRVAWTVLDVLVSMGLLGFIIINKYHFHYSYQQIIHQIL